MPDLSARPTYVIQWKQTVGTGKLYVAGTIDKILHWARRGRLMGHPLEGWTDDPIQARKFSMVADAIGWMESHQPQFLENPAITVERLPDNWETVLAEPELSSAISQMDGFASTSTQGS
jgi:hypothetical protein